MHIIHALKKRKTGSRSLMARAAGTMSGGCGFESHIWHDVIFLRPAPTRGGFDTGSMGRQATDREPSTKIMRHWRRLGAMTHLGMISYQGPAGARDGRAQVTLGYRSGGQSDWGQAYYIRTKRQEAGLTALSSSLTTNTDLLWQPTCIHWLRMHSTRTA